MDLRVAFRIEVRLRGTWGVRSGLNKEQGDEDEDECATRRLLPRLCHGWNADPLGLASLSWRGLRPVGCARLRARSIVEAG